MKEHQNHTKTFVELNFKEQSQSINAQIINLERQFKVHFDEAKPDDKVKAKVKEKLIKSAIKLTSYANGL